jgi:ATP-dependent Clp protease ATP-binding subunit ClpA
MRWRRARLTVLAAIGDDGLGPLWQRLSADGGQALRLAFVEARELGHPGIADEHLLLGVLRHGSGPAATVLRDHGLDLDTARNALLAVGPTLHPRTDPAAALRAVGIDVDRIRERLDATFGAPAVRAAERRVRRRGRWRGGHPRPRPLCVHLLAKRALQFAVEQADRSGARQIEPHHLLYGALRDARDPLGTQLSRRHHATLAPMGWVAGRSNPLQLLLRARGLDPTNLAAELGAMS